MAWRALGAAPATRQGGSMAIDARPPTVCASPDGASSSAVSVMGTTRGAPSRCPPQAASPPPPATKGYPHHGTFRQIRAEMLGSPLSFVIPRNPPYLGRRRMPCRAGNRIS